jgi:tetratricopeptide (TPR) repeat protein
MGYRAIIVFCFVAPSLVSSFAQQETPPRAKYELNQGVAAYKSGKYEDAVEHFRDAVRLDPDSTVAHLYLATSFASQYIPGVDTPENVKMATDAIDQYSEVLQRQADSINSIKAIAYLYMQMKNFEDARKYDLRAIGIDPNDPELYYSVAVMDWTHVYQALNEERDKMNLRPSETLIFDPVCRDLRAKNLPLVEEGMSMLVKAISLRENYDDAMAYMNLLYRSRADLECGQPGARAADVRKADEWADLAMAARGKKMETAKEKADPPSRRVLRR